MSSNCVPKNKQKERERVFLCVSLHVCQIHDACPPTDEQRRRRLVGKERWSLRNKTKGQLFKLIESKRRDELAKARESLLKLAFANSLCVCVYIFCGYR